MLVCIDFYLLSVLLFHKFVIAGSIRKGDKSEGIIFLLKTDIFLRKNKDEKERQNIDFFICTYNDVKYDKQGEICSSIFLVSIHSGWNVIKKTG